MVHHRIAATLLPLVALSMACTSVVPVSPATFVSSKAPGQVWVTKTDNSVVAVGSPHIVADTLTGFVNGEYAEMPLASVQSMRARQPAPRRTVLLLGGITLAGAGAVTLTVKALQGSSSPLDNNPNPNCVSDPNGCNN